AADLLETPLVEATLLLAGLVPRLRKVDIEREDAVGLQAGRHTLDAAEAAEQKARGHRQDEGEGHLGDKERGTEALARGAPRRGVAGLAQSGLGIASRCLRGGSEAE